jgi:hypothetical protein
MHEIPVPKSYQRHAEDNISFDTGVFNKLFGTKTVRELNHDGASTEIHDSAVLGIKRHFPAGDVFVVLGSVTINGDEIMFKADNGLMPSEPGYRSFAEVVNISVKIGWEHFERISDNPDFVNIISRHHFTLTRTPYGVEIVNRGSNGTVVLSEGKIPAPVRGVLGEVLSRVRKTLGI